MCVFFICMSLFKQILIKLIAGIAVVLSRLLWGGTSSCFPPLIEKQDFLQIHFTFIEWFDML